MADKPNLPDNLIPMDDTIHSNINLDKIDISQLTPLHKLSNVKQVTDVVQPPSIEEKFKPITDRQDKTINTLEKQINVYKTENQSLKDRVETISLQLQEESLRREIAEAKQELAESKLSAKEWKNLIFGGIIGAVITEGIALLSKILFG